MKFTMFTARYRSGFTILEVLVALAASLLLMVGLTRAFKLIGDRITSSQSNLELAGELRDATFRMRDELRHLTPTISAPLSPGQGGGYLHYYEGPWTDATTSLVNGATPNPDAANYFPTSRYGDLDDYLAFTTRTDPDKPFSGFVPAGIVEVFRLERHFAYGNSIGTFRTVNGKTIGSGGTFTADDASAQVLIYSDIAEVCYFLAPQWTRSALGVPTIADPTVTPPSTSPTFLDVVNETGSAAVGDGIPDRLALHRRLLLIRDDLNMTIGTMNKVNADLGAAGVVDDGTIRPEQKQLPFFNGTSVVPLTSLPQYSPGAWVAATAANSPNWMTGMARVHQWMDLSVSRHIYNPDPIPSTGPLPPLGTPVIAVRANSLEELAIPDNRFAAVRIPIGLLTGTTAPFSGNPIPFPANSTSSMPLLALSPPHDLITSAAGNGFITAPGVVNFSVTGGQAAGAAPFNPFALVGFIRPEFSLADHSYDLATPIARPTLRGGSDIVANDVLAFDVQVFDPDAVVAIWKGPDGVAGTDDPILIPPAPTGTPPGDDDWDGIANNITELGYAGSDDVLVDVGSQGIRTALSNPSPPASGLFGILPYGAFVDNGYARLAGGSIGGNRIDRIPAGQAGFFITTYSGIGIANTYPLDWHQSGAFVLSSGVVPSFYQASIDTWSDIYDRDDFVQGAASWLAPSSAPLAFTGNQGITSAGSRYWTSDTTAFASENRFVAAPSTAMPSNFAESVPPSTTMPRALKITVRVYDRNAGQVRQQTVIESL